MRFLPRFDSGDDLAEDAIEFGNPRGADIADAFDESMDAVESNLLKTIGWVSAALGAVALGLMVGREIRSRYKFNRRTPYDLYSHSGDKLPDVDFGVGI